MGCGTLSVNAIAPESTTKPRDVLEDASDVGSVHKDPIPKDFCHNEEAKEPDKRQETGDWNGNHVSTPGGKAVKADSQSRVTDSVILVQPASAWGGDTHQLSASEETPFVANSIQQQGTKAESGCVLDLQPAGMAILDGDTEGGRKGESRMEQGSSEGEKLEVDGQASVKVKKKEKKAKEAQKKTKKKEGKSSGTSISGQTLDEFTTAVENPFVPQFVFKCVSYIEKEGLRTEGLYRIPGNKAQGELFVSKFTSDPNVDISTLEIPVNAIATLLKSFFSDLSEALIPSNLCDELMEAGEMSGNKSERLIMLRGVIKKLPDQNLEVLKYLISHLYKVSKNSEWNSMSSRNLAKCWWPTLMRLQFKSYEKMIQGSQIPEDIVHALIEQCPFFFYGGNEQ